MECKQSINNKLNASRLYFSHFHVNKLRIYPRELTLVIKLIYITYIHCVKRVIVGLFISILFESFLHIFKNKFIKF